MSHVHAPAGAGWKRVGARGRAEVGPFARRVLALLVGAHGIAFFAGTVDIWDKAAGGASADWLGGAWQPSNPVLLRAAGILWALAGIGFVVSAIMLWMKSRGWPEMLGAAAGLSLPLLVVALPASIVGLVASAVLLVVALPRIERIRP
jgi:hypothetical protein